MTKSCVVGLIPILRWLVLYSLGEGKGNIQSLLLGALLAGLGAALVVVGLVADLIGVNRMLLEDIRWRVREMELREHSARHDAP